MSSIRAGRPDGDGAGADARQRDLWRACARSQLLESELRPQAGRLIARVRQRRGLCALRLRRPGRLALRRRGLQPRLGRRGARRPARFGRTAARARAAAVRRRRRLPARPALDARAVPADHGVRHGRQAPRTGPQVGLPADLLIDTGHPAGLRMRDRGAFNDPASPQQALLIECGQHWERRAVDVARDTLAALSGRHRQRAV